MKHSVTVQIAGVRYALKTDEDERWVKAVAAMVDERFRDVQKKTRTPDTQAVAMLTALQIAEELFRERRDTRVNCGKRFAKRVSRCLTSCRAKREYDRRLIVPVCRRVDK